MLGWFNADAALASPKAFDSLRIVGKLFREEFQRHIAAELCVLGLIDHTHPTATKFLDNSVVGDRLADKRVGVRHYSPW